jgi:hypothetical protein
VALALEIFFRDALLHAALQNGGGARAVAELGLLAPEEVVREPAFEGHPEEPLEACS